MTTVGVGSLQWEIRVLNLASSWSAIFFTCGRASGWILSDLVCGSTAYTKGEEEIKLLRGHECIH